MTLTNNGSQKYTILLHEKSRLPASVEEEVINSKKCVKPALKCNFPQHVCGVNHMAAVLLSHVSHACEKKVLSLRLAKGSFYLSDFPK